MQASRLGMSRHALNLIAPSQTNLISSLARRLRTLLAVCVASRPCYGRDQSLTRTRSVNFRCTLQHHVSWSHGRLNRESGFTACPFPTAKKYCLLQKGGRKLFPKACFGCYLLDRSHHTSKFGSFRALWLNMANFLTTLPNWSMRK
jgi:hypothetical protein